MCTCTKEHDSFVKLNLYGTLKIWIFFFWENLKAHNHASQEEKDHFRLINNYRSINRAEFSFLQTDPPGLALSQSFLLMQDDSLGLAVISPDGPDLS